MLSYCTDWIRNNFAAGTREHQPIHIVHTDYEFESVHSIIPLMTHWSRRKCVEFNAFVYCDRFASNVAFFSWCTWHYRSSYALHRNRFVEIVSQAFLRSKDSIFARWDAVSALRISRTIWKCAVVIPFPVWCLSTAVDSIGPNGGLSFQFTTLWYAIYCDAVSRQIVPCASQSTGCACNA